MSLIGPAIASGFALFVKTMGDTFAVVEASYGQSAGYAEQALSAIKVVIAFGNELIEVKNYSKFLEHSRQATIKSGVKLGVFFGFLLFTIYGSYAYAFIIGSIWVDRGFPNHAANRPYSPGDIVGVFFGVLLGFFGLAGIGPNAKLVAEGKTSGKMAFDAIDRKPLIDMDDKGEAIDLKGKIEFKNVTFFYPTRADQTVLKQFSVEFELGKTTAIVGPSGSGKSTIV